MRSIKAALQQTTQEAHQIIWERRHNRRLARLRQEIAKHSRPDPNQAPVAFFNASTRIRGLSQNAAFSLLTAWGLELAGLPTVHFVCQAGMSRCVLGTNREAPTARLPCKSCIWQSKQLYPPAPTQWFSSAREASLDDALSSLSVVELSAFEYQGIPLGSLALPSLRWILRRHNLEDDSTSRLLFSEFLRSAYRVYQEFTTFLERMKPSAAVVFNGLMFPEATARWAAAKRGVRVITHEVGFRPFSAFFTDGQATAYPIRIPDSFELDQEQAARLDAYLEQRFQGNFSMAGIQFWPEMRGLDEGLLQHAARFKQIVPVFTNVVFDTSQVHANTVFDNMFEWLDLVLDAIRNHSETLFVIRAHPDELRPGKEGRETVQAWAERCQINQLPNVIFIGPTEYLSSYELTRRSKFVLVYNSSIGLEATLLGIPGLCGGKARYTQYPTVHFPSSRQAFRQQLEAFLDSNHIEVPAEFVQNARRFLYFQLFHASLPFGQYLQDGFDPGFAALKPFSWQDLLTESDPTMQVLVDGIVNGKPFYLPH